MEIYSQPTLQALSKFANQRACNTAQTYLRMEPKQMLLLALLGRELILTTRIISCAVLNVLETSPRSPQHF